MDQAIRKGGIPFSVISSQMPVRQSFACLGSSRDTQSSKFMCLGSSLTSSAITMTIGQRGRTVAIGSGLNGNLRTTEARQSRHLPGRAHGRLRTWKVLRGVGSPGLKKLSDGQENNQGEKDSLHAGLVHFKRSAVPKSRISGLTRIGID